MPRPPPLLGLLVAALILGSCSTYGDSNDETYSISSASGALASWVETMTCSCSMDKKEVQFGCQRASDDPIVSFFAPVPPANVRHRGFVQMYLTRPYVEFDAFANARAEYELQSEEIVYQVEGSKPTRYRALLVHQLYFEPKHLCAVLDQSSCIDLGEGRLTDARFLCRVSD